MSLYILDKTTVARGDKKGSGSFSGRMNSNVLLPVCNSLFSGQKEEMSYERESFLFPLFPMEVKI